MVIGTERLLLRPLEPTDVPELVALWTDPVVTEYLGGPRDLEMLMATFKKELINPSPELFDQWPVIEKETNFVVGYCGMLHKLVDKKNEVELVYVFHQSAWGKGYATEISSALRNHAFNRMRIRRLISLIDPDNDASARVAEKVGMTFEKQTIRPGGKVVKVYSIEKENSQ